MKRMNLFHLFWILPIVLLACTGTPTATPNDQAALCIQGVTTSRQAATALLRAGKITVDKDREIQASLDAAVPGCRLLGAPQ